MSKLIWCFFFFLLGFVWVLPIFLKVFSFFGVRATIVNPKSHYTRHVKLDFGGLLVFVWVLPIFLKVFSSFGVRATILNPKNVTTPDMSNLILVFFRVLCNTIGARIYLKIHIRPCLA